MHLSSWITAVDAHACGEPGRVIVGGVLDVPGKTMFEKKVFLEEHADDLRYPQEMTTLALHFAVNYVIYSMTH